MSLRSCGTNHQDCRQNPPFTGIGFIIRIFRCRLHNLEFSIQFQLPCPFEICLLNLLVIKDKKNRFFGRFFGEKSVFSWVGNNFRKEKSEVKKSEKNRLFFPIKYRFFPKKTDFSWKKSFEPTQNAWKWHPPTTKPLITLIIYNINFFLYSINIYLFIISL